MNAEEVMVRQDERHGCQPRNCVRQADVGEQVVVTNPPEEAQSSRAVLKGYRLAIL